MNIYVEAVALTVGALFPIMNPFTTAPLFVSLSAGFDARKRNQQALLACIYAFGILVAFLLVGTAIVDFFGISVPGIRVAGGMIITYVGFRMLFPPPPVHLPEGAQPPPAQEIAFSPIAMPSLAGAGSISVVLSAAVRLRSIRPDDWQAIYIAVIIGMVLTLVLAYIILRLANSMARLLGDTGIDAMTRIFGFLLICMGMQFLLTGISDFYGIHHV
jgi:multiple antibiotic resistance protein